MEPALENMMLPRSPFRGPKGGVDINGLCSLLQFDQATLARTLGVSRQAVSQQLRRKAQYVQPRSEAVRVFWDELNQVVALLYALTDGTNNEDEIRLWLYSPNKALNLERPIDLIKRRKLEPLREALMDAFTAAHGGLARL
jgi:uncharacterized protein (DUF2384 family)